MGRRVSLIVLTLAVALGVACVAGAHGGRHPGGLPAGARVDRLVVRKSARVLEAYGGEVLLRTYGVSIGTGGAGPKRWEGDGRTPEGTYTIDARHRSRAFHRFLHVSYPSAEDRRRYRRARAAGQVPAGRGIGGDIGIHGTPADFFGLRAALDWTAGCIAVSDDEAEELYRAVAPGAVIEILP